MIMPTNITSDIALHAESVFLQMANNPKETIQASIRRNTALAPNACSNVNNPIFVIVMVNNVRMKYPPIPTPQNVFVREYSPFMIIDSIFTLTNLINYSNVSG